MDRYCEKEVVGRNEYQLLGVTAMLIAAKYEEIYVPKIEDFVDITDNTYTKAQILTKEFQILKSLNFEITFPTMYRFMERFNDLMHGSQEVFFMACYLLELCLIEVRMNKWTPSRVACSALYLSRKMLQQAKPWSREMQAMTSLTEREVRESAKEICNMLNLAHQKKIYEPIFKKYSTQKYLQVAQVPVRIK